MEYTAIHLARMYEAKYSLAFSEGYCIASKLFDIASDKAGKKLVQDMAYIEGALMMLYAQERIEKGIVNEVLQDALRIARRLPSADAEAELQCYINELLTEISVDVIQKVVAEINKHE